MNDAGSRITAPSPGCPEAISGPAAGGVSRRPAISLGDRAFRLDSCARIYQASSPEAIREHASRAELPVDEIIPVLDTVLVRSDPETASP
jgi:hypothetical protein